MKQTFFFSFISKDNNDSDLDGNAVVRRYMATGAQGPPTEEVLSRFEHSVEAAILVCEEATGYWDQSSAEIHKGLAHRFCDDFYAKGADHHNLQQSVARQASDERTRRQEW